LISSAFDRAGNPAKSPQAFGGKGGVPQRASFFGSFQPKNEQSEGNAAEQPHDLDVARGFGVEPPRRADAV
jgi:hypothetical protein